MDNFNNLYLPFPTAWFLWHSNPNQLELFKPQFSTFVSHLFWMSKISALEQVWLFWDKGSSDLIWVFFYPKIWLPWVPIQDIPWTLSTPVPISSPAHFQPRPSPSLPDHHIWVQHSNIGKILNFFPQLRIKYGNKVPNSDFRSRNCKEHYLQGVRHMKICPCLSSPILRHSHLPWEISLAPLQLFLPQRAEETSFLETQILLTAQWKSLIFKKYCKKNSKYLSRLQQPVQNLLQQIPMGKGW